MVNKKWNCTHLLTNPFDVRHTGRMVRWLGGVNWRFQQEDRAYWWIRIDIQSFFSNNGKGKQDVKGAYLIVTLPCTRYTVLHRHPLPPENHVWQRLIEILEYRLKFEKCEFDWALLCRCEVKEVKEMCGIEDHGKRVRNHVKHTLMQNRVSLYREVTLRSIKVVGVTR